MIHNKKMSQSNLISGFENNIVFKIAVVGHHTSGKTSLLQKYTRKSLQKDYMTTLGAQFSKFTAKVDKNYLKLYFWDITDDDKLRSLRRSFLKDSNAGIIVFSYYHEESFELIENLYDNIKEFCGDIPIILLGNLAPYRGSRRRKEVTDKQVLTLTKDRNFTGFFKVDPKDKESFQDIFQFLTISLYN